MSYANVVSSSGLPPSQQPHPDPSLLETGGHSGRVADDGAKVNVVPADFKSNPKTTTSIQDIKPDTAEGEGSKRAKARKKTQDAEAGLASLLQRAKYYLLQPGVAGGLIGLVNIGLLAGAGRAFYTQPHYRSDAKIISATLAGSVIILSAEGALADAYSKTEAGQEEARRAKEEGALLYRHSREIILRPGVLGGLVGVVNAAILGAVGYVTYNNWDRPSWDRRVVSAISVGLLALSGGEGYLAEQYRKK